MCVDWSWGAGGGQSRAVRGHKLHLNRWNVDAYAPMTMFKPSSPRIVPILYRYVPDSMATPTYAPNLNTALVGLRA